MTIQFSNISHQRYPPKAKYFVCLFVMNTWIVKRNFLIISLVLGMAILISSCADEGINITCADPIGSAGIRIKDNSIVCFSDSFDGCFIFNVSGSSVNISSISLLEGVVGSIIDIGNVDCLGGIDIKPSSGYSQSVPIFINHGYVAQLADTTFGRLYVDSFVEPSVNNDTLKVNITWQYAY